jgi:prolyl-tRNA editing enzyme YbaK/EbsC (Cys-tRNA(Pro) deacylase)
MSYSVVSQLHPNGVIVRGALDRAGVMGVIVETAESSPTAVAAAAQLGISVGQIANSLIFEADGTPLLVMTSGAHRVDTTRLATQLGFAVIRRPGAEFVREHTGQPIGGVAPVGHPLPLTTIVDVALEQYDEIWAAAGHPHYVFPTTFEELVAMTNGQVLTVGVES